MRNTYSLPYNLFLALLALLALVYALPNLYSDDPVVQIASTNPDNLATITPQVTEWLNHDQIKFLSVRSVNQELDIRFKSTDAQLQARDVLQRHLGSGYSVGLTLLPSTPSWLRAIGAMPMRQGLDLRGGVHFLLEVDLNRTVTRRYEGLTKLMAQSLREQHIRYTGMRYLEGRGIVVRFSDAVAREAAQQYLSTHYTSVLVQMDTAPNTMGLIATLLPEELLTIKQHTLDQTVGILRKRVNELGVGEAVVQQQGSSRIAVDLPGIQDAMRAKHILGGTATLQFHLVDAAHDALQAKETGEIPLSSQLYMLNGQPILLKRQVVLSGDAITSAMATFDQESARPAVSIQLGGGGETLFTQTTRDNIGKRMAIVYVETKTQVNPIDEKAVPITRHTERVISAPVIQSALGSQFQITGLRDRDEANDLALLLRAGALPTAIYPVEERMVGPSLGQDNIHRGMVSLAVGMGLILALMAVYYRLFGWIANAALALNLVFLVALLSILGATLTLPGIAGIVLTVGMAVDANVLIYERIREELRAGMSPQAAIHAGYARAFATITDANVTTLIVAVVLFTLGSGPVRGFAVTLSLGLLTSMLSGVTYTRALVNGLYGHRHVSKLSIGI